MMSFKSELANIKNTIILFVCLSNILRKHCFYFLLGLTMVPRETLKQGQHTVPKNPEHLRICTPCQLNNIENETRVLFSYMLYNALRSKFYDEILHKHNFFQDLDINSKILFF